MKLAFDYGFARVSDLTIHTRKEEKQEKAVVTSIELDGEKVQPTKRFWTSFFMRFGIADNVFRYFDHEEVFDRIAQRAKNDQLRFCIERGGKEPQLLGVSNPDKPIIGYDEVIDLAGRYGSTEQYYHNGIVTTTHVPRSGDSCFQIGGDEFKHRFVMDTPIDGFSQPKIHLSFLRMICSNGAIGYTRAFRSELNVGKDIAFCLARALESYDNDDGYSVLRQRFLSAQTSWASLYECEQLYRVLAKQQASGNIVGDETLLGRYQALTGNLHEFYGLANLDALSVKRQRILPSKTRVYDLINFASEVATHKAKPDASRALQAHIGSLISDEYDMEGTAEKADEFQDLFLPSDSGPSPSLN